MYNLLIVDDEPIIADSLSDLFTDYTGLEFEVSKAYSAKKALGILNTTRMDIVLTDIRMPGMSGIEMLEEIHGRWPQCKVIFLTGYDNFEYAYKAIEDKAFAYILKTEGDEKIIKVVEKAVYEIKKERNDYRTIEKAKQQMLSVLPLLQKDYIFSLLNGDIIIKEEVGTRFRELEIPLEPDIKILPFIERVDSLSRETSYTDRTLYLFAIQNVTEELLSSSFICLPVNIDYSKILWLIQPKREQLSEDEEIVWEELLPLLNGRLEMIQNTCKELLNFSISFVAASQPYKWNNLGIKYDCMKMMLDIDLGLGKEMILTEKDRTIQSGQFPHLTPQYYDSKLELIKTYLETGHKDKFNEEFPKLIDSIKANFNLGSDYFVEMRYKLLLLFISFLNRSGLMGEVPEKVNLPSLMHMGENASWDRMKEELVKLGGWIMDNRSNRQEKKINELIKEIQKYIMENLDKDLSLTRLSDMINMNSTYFSRLYKQISGVNLSDFINEMRINKACDLLRNTNLKMHEIAAATGYFTVSNFNRFFKKMKNKTPQEYRDSV